MCLAPSHLIAIRILRKICGLSLIHKETKVKKRTSKFLMAMASVVGVGYLMSIPAYGLTCEQKCEEVLATYCSKQIVVDGDFRNGLLARNDHIELSSDPITGASSRITPARRARQLLNLLPPGKHVSDACVDYVSHTRLIEARHTYGEYQACIKRCAEL